MPDADLRSALACATALFDAHERALQAGDADALPGLGAQLRATLAAVARAASSPAAAAACRPQLTELAIRSAALQALAARRLQPVGRALETLSPGATRGAPAATYGGTAAFGSAGLRGQSYERA